MSLSFPAIPGIVKRLDDITPPTQSESVQPGNLNLIRGTVIAVNNTASTIPSSVSPVAISTISTSSVIAGHTATALQPNVTTSSAHGLQSGATVSITGVAGLSGVAGVYQVTVLSSTQFYIVLQVAASGTYTASTGTMTPVQVEPYSCHLQVRGTDFYSVPWIGPPPTPRYYVNGTGWVGGQVWCLGQPPSLYVLGNLSQYGGGAGAPAGNSYLGSFQGSLTAGTPTVVGLTNEFAIGGMQWNQNQYGFVVPFTGKYAIEGECTFSGSASPGGPTAVGPFLSYIYVNGSSVRQGQSFCFTAGISYNNAAVNGLISLNAGDLVQLMAYAGPSGQYVMSTSALTWMSIVHVA